MDVIWILSGYYLDIIWILSGYYPDISFYYFVDIFLSSISIC